MNILTFFQTKIETNSLQNLSKRLITYLNMFCCEMFGFFFVINLIFEINKNNTLLLAPLTNIMMT